MQGNETATRKKKGVDLGRLFTAMQRDRLSLRRFREERREMVRQYVGHHWSEEGTREKVPVNLIALYISVVARNLIAKEPRVMLSTPVRQIKAPVSAMQSWANREMQRMKLAMSLGRVVLDALFSIGICKVALAMPKDSALRGWNQRTGEPFAERVDLDDFVFDVHARDLSEVSYIGHRFRCPLEVVKESRLYNKVRKDLEASSDELFNVEGDERINVLGRSRYAANAEEFEDMVDLWEIYIPRKRLILTLADQQLIGAEGLGPGNDALREVEWLGPDVGPYHILPFGTVPGNPMAKGPLMDLVDLHDLCNRVYRKLGRQAERQKELLGVAGGATEDGNRVMEANDGDIIRSDNSDRLKPLEMGGANERNLAFANHIKDLFGYMAGNLDMMGGLSPQSKTLGQDRMLAENASRAVVDMQERTIVFTADVVKALCWYWWHDPMRTMKVTHALPGMPNYSIQRKVTPEQRQLGDFEDLEINVDPYSLQHQTPQQRMQALNSVVQQTIMPMMGQLQQQGIGFDVNAYLQKIAQYMDMPDLMEIIQVQAPPQQQDGGGGQSPGQGGQSGMAPQTTRTYERVSRSGGTAGKDQAMLDLLGAKNVQQNGEQQ